MSKQMTILIGVFLIVLAIAGGWYWLSTSKPSQADIDAAATQIAPVNANILTDNSMKNINNKSIYGDVPVKVESDYQNSDLFN